MENGISSRVINGPWFTLNVLNGMVFGITKKMDLLNQVEKK